MKLVKDQIGLKELKMMATAGFGNLVKLVVDIEKNIMVVDAELHADEEAFLIQNGSRQQNLWGINLYPEFKREDWIEFDSMINLKPAQGNRSRTVENPEVREKIIVIVNGLVKE